MKLSQTKRIFILIALSFVFLPLGYSVYNYPVSIAAKTAENYYFYLGYTKNLINGLETFSYDKCHNSQNCTCSILLHGLGDNYLTWLPLAEKLKEQQQISHKVFVVNLPGSGASHFYESRQDYKGSSVAQHIYESFKNHCHQATFIGNSFGGFISLKLATLFPHFVKSLLLTSPAGLNKDYSHITNVYLDPDVNGLRHLHKLGYVKTWPVPDFIYKDMVSRINRIPVKDYILAQSTDEALEKELQQLKVPTLILWGTYDRLIPPEHGFEMSQLIPKSELRVIDDCAHMAQKECTQEVFKSFLYLKKILESS